MEALGTMWLQARLYILVGLMFAILYGILVGIGYYLQITGLTFYLFIVGIAAAFVLIQYVIGPKIVEWSMRIKYVNEQEYPRLHQMVAELSERAGLPNKPKVGISQLPIPNAFAFGRTKRGSRVCVTKGLLDLLSEDELKAVLGHEISHIKHRDVAVITMLSVIPMICYMIYVSFLWGGMGRRDRDSGGAIAIGVLALVVYFITNLLVMYGSRIREYYADQGSAELGNQPHHLATALYKLTVSSARTPRNALKQTEGMKAFFINDPSRAMFEVRELKDIDIDMSGTIDQSELMMLSTKKISLKTTDKLIEVLSTHPNVVKRIKHLASLTMN
ncbi:MAG: zinc metalloprotease HtpX [Candidatus Thermoplasmatota archaeon]|nr:zinc metalloprotease HtpX [Candidatus Thermoplasmatota archaeon]